MELCRISRLLLAKSLSTKNGAPSAKNVFQNVSSDTGRIMGSIKSILNSSGGRIADIASSRVSVDGS